MAVTLLSKTSQRTRVRRPCGGSPKVSVNLSFSLWGSAGLAPKNEGWNFRRLLAPPFAVKRWLTESILKNPFYFLQSSSIPATKIKVNKNKILLRHPLTYPTPFFASKPIPKSGEKLPISQAKDLLIRPFQRETTSILQK